MREFVDRAARQGVEVILLAAFNDRIATSEEARGLAEWAREFGPGGTFWNGRSDGAYAVRYIEFGNETSYAHQGMVNQGGEYALRAKEAIDAIKAANPRVGLLVQADDANINPSPWVRDMHAAVPNLGNLAAGWTVHPYGPRVAVGAAHRPADLPDRRRRLARAADLHDRVGHLHRRRPQPVGQLHLADQHDLRAGRRGASPASSPT